MSLGKRLSLLLIVIVSKVGRVLAEPGRSRTERPTGPEYLEGVIDLRLHAPPSPPPRFTAHSRLFPRHPPPFLTRYTALTMMDIQRNPD